MTPVLVAPLPAPSAVVSCLATKNPLLNDLVDGMCMQPSHVGAIEEAARQEMRAKRHLLKKVHHKVPAWEDIDKIYDLSINPNYRPDMSYRELRKAAMENSTISTHLRFTVKNGTVRVSKYCLVQFFAGRRAFRKRVESQWFCFSKGKIYGTDLFNVIGPQPYFRAEIFKHLGISWLNELPDEDDLQLLAGRPAIFKSILLGNIYNQETLIKAIGKRLYHLKEFSWKTLRAYLTIPCGSRCSLYNLQDFTHNLNVSMQRFVDADEVQRSLYCDMVKMAALEDGVVSLAWSEKRLHAEHMAQIMRAHMELLENQDTSCVHSPEKIASLNTDEVTFLNSELSVFLEGSMMHHCLYSCYWPQIFQHHYFAFHLVAPQECTLGVRVALKEGTLHASVDQIYQRYDVPVSEETEKFAECYVAEHEAEIVDLFSLEQKRLDAGAPVHHFDDCNIPF